MCSIGGSVVEFSPATREARVRFPANAKRPGLYFLFLLSYYQHISTGHININYYFIIILIVLKEKKSKKKKRNGFQEQTAEEKATKQRDKRTSERPWVGSNHQPFG